MAWLLASSGHQQPCYCLDITVLIFSVALLGPWGYKQQFICGRGIKRNPITGWDLNIYIGHMWMLETGEPQMTSCMEKTFFIYFPPMVQLKVSLCIIMNVWILLEKFHWCAICGQNLNSMGCYFMCLFFFFVVAVVVSKTILLFLQQLYSHFHSITDSWHILGPEYNGVYSADDKCVFFQQMASNFKRPNHVRCCRRYHHHHHHHIIIRCQAVIWTNAGIYIIFWTLTNKIMWNLNQNSYILVQENAFQNVVSEMAAILSRPQCVLKQPKRPCAIFGLMEVNRYQHW